MDLSRRTLQLCAEGTGVEFDWRLDDARELYRQAWDAATDDYDACVAAHYIAHLERDVQAQLAWNEEALARAERLSPEDAEPFLGSLYVNLGHSYESTGDAPSAERYYQLAAGHGVVHRA